MNFPGGVADSTRNQTIEDFLAELSPVVLDQLIFKLAFYSGSIPLVDRLILSLEAARADLRRAQDRANRMWDFERGAVAAIPPGGQR